VTGRSGQRQAGNRLAVPHKPDVPSAWESAVSPASPDHFRPDIEGLRAVAVAAVVMYHAGMPFITGGFIGVDVFYVISGFLITGLLLREYRQSGRIALTTFYARRMRRLLPAALTVILVTLGLSALTLSVIQLRTVATDAAAAALYVSNYRFALSATDYLAAQDPSPLLHYWSLGVEEQFYLFWPLLVIVSARLLGLRRLWWVVAVVAIASFGLSIWLTGEAQPWAFFSLPTRAWELALGALAAIGVVTLPARWRTITATRIGLGGLAIVAMSIVAIRPDMPFPGLVAAVPVVGALMIIVSGERGEALGARLLAVRPMRWIGRISYSLYLWHWPILLLVPLLIGRNDPITMIVLVALCVVIADLSTRLIESPFRSRRVSRFPAARVAMTGLIVSVLVAGGSLAVGDIAVARLRHPETTPRPDAGALTSPSPSHLVAFGSPVPRLSPGMTAPASTADVGPPSGDGSPLPSQGSTPIPRPTLPPALLAGPLPDNLQPSLLDADGDVAQSLTDNCQAYFTVVTPPDCAYGDLSSPTTVVLFGDSHAAQWLPAIQQLAADRHWKILPMTKANCPPIGQLTWLVAFSRSFTECLDWQEAALSKIESIHPALLFVTFSREFSFVEDGNLVPATQDLSRLQSGMTAMLQRAKAAADRTIYIADTPRPVTNPVNCLADKGLVEDCALMTSDAINSGYAATEEAAAAASGVPIIRPADFLCATDICPLVFGNTLVYRDASHITATFSATLAPILGWYLDVGLSSGTT